MELEYYASQTYHNPVVAQWPGRDRDFGASNQPPGLFDGGGAIKYLLRFTLSIDW